ncbi:MAG: TIGR03960 family B12-binding radical SAM protein [Oscillospiraceae bacterium]|nr:TIGR03960 family B12-binding radical SAM protein [Oscillospiraceae bacterium]
MTHDFQTMGGIERPARYTGGEWGSVTKDKAGVDVRFAFCFPDTYEIGMSNLGMRILYHLINGRGDAWCERVFAPWHDMEGLMRASGTPLAALESGDPVRSFDLVGFTAQYEMGYTNMLNMLDLAGIPLYAKDRGEGDPLVLGGGPCVCNPEPIADFLDFILIGEGEEAVHEIIDLYAGWKRSGRPGGREGFLRGLCGVGGVYVPRFYDVAYDGDGTVAGVWPNVPFAPERVVKRVVADLDAAFFPTSQVVPYVSAVHDRIALELFRGCAHGCRFCQACFIYRPVRERSVGTLIGQASRLIDQTGYEELSLVSLSTGDYCALGGLVEGLSRLASRSGVSIAFPSLRIDSHTSGMMGKSDAVRRGGLTLAPEAGSQRLRDVISKGVTEADMMKSADIAFGSGYGSIKLYFMLGLPTEADEDVEAIADLAAKVLRRHAEADPAAKAKGADLTVSTSFFVPKPFTPFQWVPQIGVGEMARRRRLLKDSIKSRRIAYKWHDERVSVVEAALARGDRRLSAVLAKALSLGCKFDAWSDSFDYAKWERAFGECGLEMGFFAARERGGNEVLPWDHIDMGVGKGYLAGELRKAMEGIPSGGCMGGCRGCGAQRLAGCLYAGEPSAGRPADGPEGGWAGA